MRILYPLPPLPFEARPLHLPPLKSGHTPIPGWYTYSLDRNHQLQHYHARQARWYEQPFSREWEGSKVYRVQLGQKRHYVPLHLIWAHAYLPCPCDPAYVLEPPHPYHLNSLDELRWVDAERLASKPRLTRTRTTVWVPEILALIVPTAPGPLRGPRFPSEAQSKVALPAGFTAATYNTALLQHAPQAPTDHPDYAALQAWLAEHDIHGISATDNGIPAQRPISDHTA